MLSKQNYIAVSTLIVCLVELKACQLKLDVPAPTQIYYSVGEQIGRLSHEMGISDLYHVKTAI